MSQEWHRSPKIQSSTIHVSPWQWRHMKGVESRRVFVLHFIYVHLSSTKYDSIGEILRFMSLSSAWAELGLPSGPSRRQLFEDDDLSRSRPPTLLV